jgi:hypothetical protein
MRTKYVLDGRFTAGSREDVSGPLVIFAGDCSLSVMGCERTIEHSMLSIAPFDGSMFFGTISHSQREEVLEKGYELILNGTTIGVYEDGGGKDGEFDVFKIKEARIKGVFGPAGLTINVRAKTWRGSAVCYSAQEWRSNIYKPIEVTTEFIVPPRELQSFMKLVVSTDHDMFARFKWGRL